MKLYVEVTDDFNSNQYVATFTTDDMTGHLKTAVQAALSEPKVRSVTFSLTPPGTHYTYYRDEDSPENIVRTGSPT